MCFTCRKEHKDLVRISVDKGVKAIYSLQNFNLHELITSKLDYCNSLLSGLRQDHMKELQFVENSAARLLIGTRKHEYLSPISRSLNWLPTAERISFKLLIVAFKSPPYMEELLVDYSPKRTLRSADKGLLLQPKHNLKTYGYSAFSQAAPRYGIPCQSVYAHVESWALSNQKSKHFFLSLLFSFNSCLLFF